MTDLEKIRYFGDQEGGTIKAIAAHLVCFKQHPLLCSGHLQTIAGRYLNGDNSLRHTRYLEVALPDGDRLSLPANHPGSRSPVQKVIVFAHGLGGDADSRYMVRVASMFYRRGWTTIRMNHRGCGSGAGLARNLYHSGRSGDIAAVLRTVSAKYAGAAIIVTGFSLSGNALLKLLGENCCDLPGSLLGAIAITPPILLSVCAAALCKRQNRVYDIRFVRLLKAAIAERQQHFPDFPHFRFPGNMTVREFDEICTAPLNGFRSAEDYYQRCSAKQFLSQIRLPTFVLVADNGMLHMVCKTAFNHPVSYGYFMFCIGIDEQTDDRDAAVCFIAHGLLRRRII